MAEIYDTETTQTRSFKEKQIINIAIAALILALKIAFGFLPSIKVPKTFTIGFGFMPAMFSGMILGPIPAVIIAGLGDIIDYFMFNQAYAFNPMYTISAMVAALIWSLFFETLRQKNALIDKSFIIRVVIASLSTVIIANIIINTAAVMMDNGTFWLISQDFNAWVVALTTVLSPRLISNAIMFGVHIPIGIGLGYLAVEVRKKFLD